MKNRPVVTKDNGRNLVPMHPNKADRVAKDIPGLVTKYPELRYMGSKKRLLIWIHQVLDTLDFESALDPFSGTGCVSYLIKCMGRRVIASDFLNFSSLIAKATVENSHVGLDEKAIRSLIDPTRSVHNFIVSTFAGVFFTMEDLQFLGSVDKG